MPILFDHIGIHVDDVPRYCDFLVGLGNDADEISAQIERLSLADTSLPPDPLCKISELGALTDLSPEPAQESSGSGDFLLVADPASAPALEDGDLGADSPAEEPEELRQDLAAVASAPEEVPLPKGYLCSVSQRGRFRRLRHAGFCWRIPGIHFRLWEDLGSGDPDLVKCRIDARCADCLPAQAPEQQATEKEEQEEDGSDDDSSSSSSS